MILTTSNVICEGGHRDIDHISCQCESECGYGDIDHIKCHVKVKMAIVRFITSPRVLVGL